MNVYRFLYMFFQFRLTNSMASKISIFKKVMIEVAHTTFDFRLIYITNGQSFPVR